MKFKTVLFMALLTAFVIVRAEAQTATKIEGKNLKVLAGSWKGELTYLDYKDDKSKVVLKVRTTNVWANPNLTRNIVFTEPNGKEIKSDSVLKIGDDKRSLLEDKDTWRVVKNVFDRDKQQRIVVLETNGEDNNKKAILRKTLVIGKNQYTITKEVSYESGSEFFFRNEFRFTRAE
jgi:hypothetical protein